jgi:hypothetical protein
VKVNTRSPVEMAERCREFVTSEDEKPFFIYFCTSDAHRGGGQANDLPFKPDRFGNRPQGYPGVNEVTYDPESVVVPPYLPDTPACRAELVQYYGKRSIRACVHRPKFELYDLENDPHELENLADDAAHAEVLEELKEKIKSFQARTKDPWIMKWEYE